MVEPPYGIICNHLKKGEVVPFLGAGASLCGRPAGGTWAENSAQFLPAGRDLAQLLAEESEFPSADPRDRQDLAKVASYYIEQSERASLCARLREIFDRSFQAGQVHRFLADVPAPLLIVTTNYDDLIEQAFKAKGRPYHLVVHPTDHQELAGSVLWWKPGAADPVCFPPAKLPLSVTDTTIIYKMHGSSRIGIWDSFVITEEDYVDFLSRMTGQTAIPPRFMLHFRTRHFLFLGYGLSDWNLRVVLKNLKTSRIAQEGEPGTVPAAPTAEESMRSWAVQNKPSNLEESLWRSRNVNIYDMEIDTFVAKLCERAKAYDAT